VTDLSHAVFLSYASQDAESAQKICDALRAGGIEVFLDQSELRGGDAWDQKIRRQIHDCALFMPVVSQHTQERLEGYFRLEWKLAVDRSHLMATERPFLVPVVVDGTRDQEAFVPDAFRAVQWTRLLGGNTSAAFVERIGRLLSPELSPLSAPSAATAAIRLDDVAARVELGGTHNPAAFDAYLRASTAYHDYNGLQNSIAAYTEAIRLDPKYALAFAGRSLALGEYAAQFATGAAVRESFAKEQADARTAIALAPNLAESHVALADFFESGSLDFAQANEEYERAMSLAPGNAKVLRVYSLSSVWMGRTDAGIAAARRAIVLDPLNSNSREALGHALYYVHQYDEAIAALEDTLALESDLPEVYVIRGRSYYLLGNLQRARTSCEIKPDYWTSRVCLAITYDKLGRHADAEKMLTRLKASMGDADAYQYAQIYAQWGNTAKALESLETAMRLRDSGLVELKTDPLLDPLRQEPRFRAIERELKFPD
jgi:tetratricopeptide (TPR) repeat protein